MTDYIKQGEIPPVSPDSLVSKEDIAKALEVLVGTQFNFNRVARRDGSNFRKLVTKTLMENKDLVPKPAQQSDFEIVPPKSKGVPKFLRYYIDTYLVTTGDNYNLQVWNRNPTSDHIQIFYPELNVSLRAKDVIFVFGKIDVEKNIIESILVTTPDMIVSKFGDFGVPTSKQQLIVSNKVREKIVKGDDQTLFYEDDKSLTHLLEQNQDVSCLDVKSRLISAITPLTDLRPLLKDLIGTKLEETSTRRKGVELEKHIMLKMGYTIPESMEGQYPDLPNQMIEVKVQDSPTIDLGRYSPQDLEFVEGSDVFTTQNVRYVIAFTNPQTCVIEGFFIGPGNKLGEHFSYVTEKSVKYQKGIKMEFFENIKGSSISI